MVKSGRVKRIPHVIRDFPLEGPLNQAFVGGIGQKNLPICGDAVLASRQWHEFLSGFIARFEGTRREVWEHDKLFVAGTGEMRFDLKKSGSSIVSKKRSNNAWVKAKREARTVLGQSASFGMKKTDPVYILAKKLM